jgi:hypothetical protein
LPSRDIPAPKGNLILSLLSLFYACTGKTVCPSPGYLYSVSQPRTRRLCRSRLPASHKRHLSYSYCVNTWRASPEGKDQREWGRGGVNCGRDDLHGTFFHAFMRSNLQHKRECSSKSRRASQKNQKTNANSTWTMHTCIQPNP